MPTYEYVCKSCGDTIEKVQSFSEKPLRRHEECGGDLQKVFHARGVVFKGSGFYSTDARASPVSMKKSDRQKTSDGSKAKDGAASGSPEKSTSTVPAPAPSTPTD
ncbi:MAG TPA: FmdB family zinc ribbon protein [Acidimicrobiia bacterium]|nr:FmdB family zinc ribbon protein [Acidimicrobiia bacterium]